MKITLSLNKSTHENLAVYHDKVKEVKAKIENVKKAIADTKKEIEVTKKKQEEKKAIVKTVKEKKWFEKFNWFYTSSGKLAIGGKDAKQNDAVFAKHMEDNDLFFHADIQGGTAIILKDGVNATKEEKLETAQFAASFSNAWKNSNASVDVYCVKKEQLSKHSHGGFIPVGGFAIIGEREWFRSTILGLTVGKGNESLEIIPTNCKRKLREEIGLIPSKTGKEKGQVAKSLAKRLNVHPDELLQVLPSGMTKTKL